MTFEKEYEPKFSGFHDLMAYRVREILLVSSPYDAFVLEEDGRLSERIFGEYLDLNLQFVPRITHVNSASEAFTALQVHSYDLVITMTRIADMNPLEFGRKIKETYPGKPVILLTYESIHTDLLIGIREERCIDKIFFWSGNTRILLAIVKYIEDRENAEADSRQGVQVILVIEDSPVYYSLFLPIIYTEIMKQTQYLISHGVNDLQRLLRMRARPKIILAETYEEAIEQFDRFKQNLIGIISDVRFPKGGKIDTEAGFKLSEKVKAEIPDLPILLQSRELAIEPVARQRGVYFLNKNTANMSQELQYFILNKFGFGDFVFRYPDGREIGKASNLTEFEKMVQTIPDESLRYHAERNHFSRWLRARTEFEMADELRPKKASDFKDNTELRNFILGCIEKLFNRMQSGTITDFGLSRIDIRNSFIKLGSGSIGGKGRGIAFINALISQNRFVETYGDIEIKTPHSFILCSDVFEEFMEMNHLLDTAIRIRDDETIAARFVSSGLPPAIEEKLMTLLEKVHYPLAVRSSSMLEDSQMIPFAGLYRTYMIPNNHPDIAIRFRQLTDAIKLVYASIFYQSPREYIKNAELRIEDEKMAVLIQQVAGEPHDDIFYPVISGVAQSYNFYPISYMETDQGVVSLALGLGKTIVDGGNVYRFSPVYPEMTPPFSSPDQFLRESQNRFFALNLGNSAMKLDRNELCGYEQFDLERAEADGSLDFIASTYSAQDQSIKDTMTETGPRIVTFAPVLKFHTFPLAELLRDFFQIGYRTFGAHVEIEFAVNLYREKGKKPEFYFLQIRPMVAGRENVDLEIEENHHIEDVFCQSRLAMGNGIYSGIRDLVYVAPDRFDMSKTRDIAREIGILNRTFVEENRPYILIGFGRFGTADPWLGIPLEWYEMSRARLVIESNLDNLRIDPSQGSHFFHNMIALKMGYFHINRRQDGEFVDWDWLKKQKPRNQTEHVRHVRFERPFIARINGRTSRGIILKPDLP